MKPGKLYVVGVGPGDPELLTIKGMRVLQSVSCVCVPKGREKGSSLALSIVRRIIDLGDREIIEAHFPMKKTKNPSHGEELDAKWDQTVRTVSERLGKGIDIAFITIGDPTIYSTFFYLYDRLVETTPDLDVEIVPGVSSINASAALAKISLGLADEKIAVLPATYAENLREILQTFDTVVLMKVHRVFGRILRILDDLQLTPHAVCVSRAGMEDEKIFTDIRAIKEEDMNYFSMVIVRK
jgi:precorrin-2/cobalt-factor-2 C20-methyltransferase